ncbi:MAG: ABC transporter permease [Actinoplanes sp.]
MLRLAFRLLRHRAGTAVATLIALTAGVMILTSLGALIESGLRFRPEPQRYAAADIVVAHQEISFTNKEFDGEVVTTTVPLPEGGTVPAALAGQLRGLPGVTDVTVFPGSAPGRIDALGVVADHPDALLPQVERLAKDAGVRAYGGDDRGWAERSELAPARTLLLEIGGAFAGYVVLLIVFVVAGAVGLSVRHRRRDLALLRAVAATPGQVRRLIVAEAAMVSGVAAVLGVPAGVLATAWVRDGLVGRGFIPAAFPMTGGALSALAAVVLTTLVAMVAAFLAARRVTGIRPTEALGEVAVEPARSGKVRLVSGVLVIAGAASSMAFTVGATGEAALAGAIGMLYLLVLGVGLLAPWINRLAARRLAPALQRFWGVGGYLAAANLRANAQGMATVLTALVLSVGFGGSVWFLQDNLERHTVAQSRDGLLADRALVSPAGTVEKIRETPGVVAATPVRRTTVLVKVLDGPEPIAAQAIDPIGSEATMDLGVVDGDLADLDAESVAVSTMRADTQGWKVGDRVPLWLGDGTPATLRVAAIYQRGLGFGDVTLHRDTIRGHTARDLDDEVLIKGTAAGLPTVPADELTGRIARDLALGAWLNKLLIGVMVGYSALAAANTMVVAALARRRELALLRLVGLTRRQVRSMVNAEQAGLLGVALVIGGAIAAVTLTGVVRPLTGALLPYVPPLGWLVVIGGATLLALTTTVLPIRRLLRVPAIENIGVRE